MQKPFAITLDVGSSLANHTGSWRTSRPVYLSRKPPCNHQCPAGENIQGWLFHAESGNYEAAWRTLVEDNPFPAIMGRVCYHSCEGACNRATLDSAVGINSVERFGSPQYRLPRKVLAAEVQRIVDLGVRIEYNTKVTDVLRAKQDGGFDAVFLAVGAHIAKRAYIPAGDSAKGLDAVSVLRSMEGEEKPLLGRRVVIYGGGNTAIDVARTAKRLGATESIIVYRRNREKMPAHDFEVEEALQEGVMIKWLSTIKQAGESSITVEKMALDDKGFPQPTGEYETLEADSVVLALGQDVDLSLIEGVPGMSVEDGVVQVNAQMMTGHAGIFAGGDMVPAERNATVAIGHGKKAARNIDAWLRGNAYVAAPQAEVATYDKLNTWYYSDAPKTMRPMLDIIRRQSTFEEVQGVLDETNALFEARRCLSCGNCFECDNCYGVCPDNAVIKKGPGLGFDFNYDYCKGCGICVSECPCGAIKMEPEDI